MSKHYPPIYKQKQFHCPYCGVYASQYWKTLWSEAGRGGMDRVEEMEYSVCSHCFRWAYWYEKQLLIPNAAPVAMPHEEMPATCANDFLEARSVAAASPIAAAALLRLALQQLMADLGESGKHLNVAIASLVKKGLPVQVQQALDICRVVGNNAVHPGEINLDDTPEIAHHLFDMINFIVEDRIHRPQRKAALYESLPGPTRAAIENRDEPRP